jgi:PTS system mannose-specific IIC component
MLLELLWLCRMPVGASIPHDDTQVTIGATTLAIALSGTVGGGVGLTLCALLIALPLGKIGQIVERTVRTRNQLLAAAAQRALHLGGLPAIERLHLLGLGGFALGALTTYTAIVLIGRWLILGGMPFFFDSLSRQAVWIQLALILVGAATLLQALNVRRAYALFFSGFFLTFLLLGVLQ